jgi:putative tricarboxylic transport membrane protein
MTAEPAAEPSELPELSGRAWPHDLVAGLLAAVLGAAVVLYVRTFPELPGGAPGPALFPGIVGALLVVFGLVLAVRAVVARRRDAGSRDTPPATRSTGRARLHALAVLGFVAAYLLLAEVLGFVLTMGVLLVLLTWLLGARLWVAAAAAVATTGVILVLFREVLLVPLPSGLLG